MLRRSCLSAVALLVPIGLITSNDTRAQSWSPVVEVGVTYAPDRYAYRAEWGLVGVLGLSRRIGDADQVGPAFIGRMGDDYEDHSVGVGPRWDHEIVPGVRWHVWPGVMWANAFDLHPDRNVDYFGEMGIGYRGIVTLACRVEVNRTAYHSVVDWDDPNEGRVFDESRTHLDLRVGRMPAVVALAGAAFAGAAIAFANATIR